MADKQPVILVADDDNAIREMIMRKLTKLDMTVLMAADGAEALQVMQQCHPDLVLLDVTMPRLDGFAVTELVRANPQLMHTPILLLTARDSLDDKVAGMNAGADDYIVKPFEWPELIARLEMHLRRTKRDQGVNPLTLLPGSPSIERTIEERLKLHSPFAASYLDLDNFKSFNDRYGFIAGNDLIRMLGDITVKVVREYDESNWLVGHIGGDDFVVISSVEHVEQICDEIIRRFDQAVPELYAPEDRARGYIWTENRRGEREQFRFVSLSIAVVIYDGTPDVHPGQVSLVSAELKHYLKVHPGSIYMVNRRSWE